MRNPEERLQEIQRRADERFAAIRKTKRTVAWIASSAVMCMFIGLAIRTMSTVPPAPIVAPTTTQIVTSTVDGVTTTSTDNSPIDTTTTVVPTTTDLPVMFYTTYSPLTTATSHDETETTAAGHTNGTTHTTTHTTTTSRTTVTSVSSVTTTIAVTTTTHTSPSTTTTRNPDAGGDGNEMSPSTSPSATTTVRTTTTTATYTPSDPTTTTYATTTTTTRTPSWEGGGDIQAPAAPGDTTTEPTATTTRPPYVFYSVSSAYEVSAGDIITVDVTVSDNHYMIYGEIGVYYDKNALELLPVGNNPDSPYVDYANPDILPENASWFVDTPYVGALEFGFLSTSFCGSTTGGTIFRLTFRVLDGFENRTDIHLEFPYMVSANNPNGTAADDYNTRILKASGIISADKKPKSPYW